MARPVPLWICIFVFIAANISWTTAASPWSIIVDNQVQAMPGDGVPSAIAITKLEQGTIATTKVPTTVFSRNNAGELLAVKANLSLNYDRNVTYSQGTYQGWLAQQGSASKSDLTMGCFVQDANARCMNGTGTLASYSYANYPAGSGIPAVGLPLNFLVYAGGKEIRNDTHGLLTYFSLTDTNTFPVEFAVPGVLFGYGTYGSTIPGMDVVVLTNGCNVSALNNVSFQNVPCWGAPSADAFDDVALLKFYTSGLAYSKTFKLPGSTRYARVGVASSSLYTIFVGGESRYLSSQLSDQIFIYNNVDLQTYVSTTGAQPPSPIANRTLSVPRRDVSVFAVQDDLFLSVGGQDSNLTYYGILRLDSSTAFSDESVSLPDWGTFWAGSVLGIPGTPQVILTGGTVIQAAASYSSASIFLVTIIDLTTPLPTTSDPGIPIPTTTSPTNSPNATLTVPLSTTLSPPVTSSIGSTTASAPTVNPPVTSSCQCRCEPPPSPSFLCVNEEWIASGSVSITTPVTNLTIPLRVDGDLQITTNTFVVDIPTNETTKPFISVSGVASFNGTLLVSVPVGVGNVTVAEFGSLDRNFDNLTVSIKNSTCKKYSGRWRREQKSLGVLINVQCTSSISKTLIVGITVAIVVSILCIGIIFYVLQQKGIIGKAKSRSAHKLSAQNHNSAESYELMGNN